MAKVDDILKGIDSNYVAKTVNEETQEFVAYWKENLLPTIAEFYVCEGIKSYPVKGTTAFSPYYQANVNKAKDKHIDTLNRLADFFEKYIFVACLGEARYRGKYNITGKKYTWIPNGSAGVNSRNNSWVKGYKLYAEHKAKLLEKSEILYELFMDRSWRDNGSYGGRKWANIINHLIKYLTKEIDKLTFVDTAISMVHNGSFFVDKIVGCGGTLHALRKILDAKFNAVNPKDMLSRINIGFKYAEIEAKNLCGYADFAGWMVQ